MTDQTAGIGHNTDGLTAAQQIAENLKEKHAKLIERAELLEGMDGRAPDITDQTVADKVAEAVRQCTALEKAAEGERVAEKEPYLSAERAVDGFFRNLVKPVTAAKEGLLRKLTTWQRKIDDEKREKLRQEAAEQARQAQEAARLAAAAKTETAFQEAARAEEQAAETKKAAETTPSIELTRSRTDAGVLSGLRSEWRFEVEEPRKVPRQYCVHSDALIRGAIKAATTPDGDCPLEIKGVRIYKHTFSQVR